MKQILLLGSLFFISGQVLAQGDGRGNQQKLEMPKLSLQAPHQNQIKDKITQSIGTKKENIKIEALLKNGGHDGNGGDAVVDNEKVSLLDLVEPGYKILALHQEPYLKTIQEKIRFFVFRLNIPLSAQSKTWILTSQDLSNIKDEGSIRYTGNGMLKQLAIQKDNVIVINEELFGKLDDQNKAALIVHEILISAALDQGFDLNTKYGTAPIREVVNLLFNDNFLSVSGTFYLNLWKKLPVKVDSPASRGFNRVISKSAYAPDLQITFKIIEPRVVVGTKYYKISSFESAGLICEQIGFVWSSDTNYSVVRGEISTEELSVNIRSGTEEGLEFALTKPNYLYVREISCGL